MQLLGKKFWAKNFGQKKQLFLISSFFYTHAKKAERQKKAVEKKGFVRSPKKIINYIKLVRTTTKLLLLMVGVEGGRPKRACAMDGKIDYAGTDQVPGWTVRFVFFFLFSLFSSHRAMMMKCISNFSFVLVLLTPRLNDLRLRVLTTFLSLSLSL